VVPTCLPWIITAMRINIGLALVGVLAGEFLSSTHGLGYLIDRTAKLYEMSHTMAVLAIVVALAAAQYYMLDWFESRLFRWSREAELEFIT
jgi:NitT/TauT family transport system permease protein